jgi:glycosyltransferase involved in cell wall biosynthesis
MDRFTSIHVDHTDPKVSVCVITYNQERYIAQCLQSLVDQRTNFEFEIIVGDDFSTDGTREIVLEFKRAYPNIIRTHFQPVNTGGSRNNLEVHACARGRYVAHLDGDDYALPGKLQAQADALDADGLCNSVWHPVDFFDDTGGFCSGKTADISIFPAGKVSFGNAIRFGFVGAYSALMYRRSSLTPIDPSRQLLDLYFTWDTLSKGHGRMLSQVLGRYRVMSTGSIQVKSRSVVRRLAIAHAHEFLDRYPQHRRNFMIWAVSCVLFELKNGQNGYWDYVSFAWQARSVIALHQIVDNVRKVRRLQVKWRTRRQSTIIPLTGSG